MPTAKVRIWPFSGAVPSTVAGAGNSKFPLMKQTGNWQAAAGSPGSKGGTTRYARTSKHDEDRDDQPPQAPPAPPAG